MTTKINPLATSNSAAPSIAAGFYLQHYILQSCGRVKIAEYALPSSDAVDAMKDAIVARYPGDAVEFDVRVVR